MMTRLGERSIIYFMPLRAFTYIFYTSIKAKSSFISGGRRASALFSSTVYVSPTGGGSFFGPLILALIGVISDPPVFE